MNSVVLSTVASYQSRLGDFMVFNVDKEESKGIDLYQAIDTFSNMKFQRYPLK